MMLTKRMRDVLVFIDVSQRNASGVSPTMREIADGVGMKSIGGLSRIVNTLEERGYIRRLPSRARAIEVLRRPGEPERRDLPRCISIPVMGHIS